MAFPKEYVAYLAAELAVRVENAGKVKLHNKEQVSAKIKQLILDEFAKEEDLNQEVRDHLEKYSSEMRRTGVSYQEMYKLNKKGTSEEKPVRASQRAGKRRQQALAGQDHRTLSHPHKKPVPA